MKKLKQIAISILATLALVAVFVAADHIDAPGVTGGSSDITDYYAFQSPANNDNMVFVANVQGLLSPEATGDAMFDENVLIEFNIDNDGDLVQDLVIQAIPYDGKMVVFGPTMPTSERDRTTIAKDAFHTEVEITKYGDRINISPNNENGIRVFAGPRDDPFFFDLGAYQNILNGTATSFNSPGTDTFAGTNVLSCIVEVPKSMLGGAETLNTWVTTKRRRHRGGRGHNRN